MAGKSEDVNGRAGADTSREGGCCREIGPQAAMRFVPGGALDFLSVAAAPKEAIVEARAAPRKRSSGGICMGDACGEVTE